MKKLVLLTLLITGINQAQIVSIPDANFKAKLIALGIDTNNDGAIQASEALAVTSLNVYQVAITDLTGLEAFTNLTSFHCGGGAAVISTIDVSGLTQLTDLSCYSASIASLNVSTLTHLITLELTGNQLSSINLSGLMQLKTLNINGNQLTSLDLSGSPLLEHVNCNLNLLSNLTLTGLTHLSYLDCTQNQLTSLNVAPLTSLTVLACSANQITALDVAPLLQLQTLYCFQNQITSLNVAPLSNLHDLRCHENLMTTFDVSNLVFLDTLEFGDTTMQAVDVSALVHLTYLAFHKGTQTSMDFSALDHLNAILFYDTKLTTVDVSGCSQLNSFNFTDNIDLTFINLKNGRPMSGGIHNSMNLLYICANESDVNAITQQIPFTNNPDAHVNTYCSFVPGGNYNTITGKLLYDFNNNGCGVGDINVQNVRVNLNDGSNQGTSITNATANYYFYTGAGTFTLTPALENPNYYNVSPVSSTVTYASANNLTQTRNFCLTANGVHNDLEIVMVPYSELRPGFNSFFKVIYKNKGNQTLAGTVTLTFDDAHTDFYLSNPDATSQSPSTLTWDYSNLLPFETRVIYVTFYINSPTQTPPVNAGDFLDYTASITPLSGDDIPDDNTFHLHQGVMNSYDPNDKTCLEGDTLSTDSIGKYVHYNINFENIGTASAINVVVKDVIDTTRFDISTLQFLNASHPVKTKISGNTVEFIFEGINLPPYSADPIGGHGNVLFKLRTWSNLQAGDQIANTANIFFDYNLPVPTNNAVSTFTLLNTNSVVKDKSIRVFPNPSKSTITISASNMIKSIELYDVQGRILETKQVDAAQTTLGITNRDKGIYFLKITTEKGSTIEKIAKE